MAESQTTSVQRQVKDLVSHQSIRLTDSKVAGTVGGTVQVLLGQPFGSPPPTPR
jgi:hypothetical protein